MDKYDKIGLSAIVEYDYTAKESDELDLTKGAIIVDIKQQPGGWWEGTLKSSGKTGMFPDNFVRVLDGSDDNAVVLRDKSATAHRRCKVIYSYTQVNEDELSLAVGDVIEFLGEVEEGWWRGKLKDKVGVFPSNFVSNVDATPVLASKRPNSSTTSTIATITSSTSTSNTAINSKSNRSSLYNSKEDLLSSSSVAIPPISPTEADAPQLPPKPVREFCRVEYPYKPQNEDELELNMGEIITIISKELPDKGWWKGESRGKVGVFPDNFVKLLPPDVLVSPTNDSTSTHADRPPPTTGMTTATTTAGGTSKVFIKKSGSTSSTQSSNRKDSFGSRDSLNDILSETGIPTGNVAAQRKSLENKNLELTSNGASDAVAVRGAGRRSLETKSSEMRKSLEIVDEKKTPPPVLTKKPTVPIKKSSTVTSVAGNIFSGLKNKVKSVEQKLTSSQDTADGVGSSKLPSQVADNGEKGVTVERMKKDDSDFDNVERGSILPDMRAGRVKAPKRRPPSAVINVSVESNNNNSVYLNGSGAYVPDETRVDNEEELAKPKPREWEKKKAPWMAELKASQEKKKTSPNIEPRIVAAERSSKSEESSKTSTTTTTISVPTGTSISSSPSTNNSFAAPLRRSIETTPSVDRKDASNDMTKSMSAAAPNIVLLPESSNSKEDDIKIRPSSLSIRNRSVSPLGRSSVTKSVSVEQKSSSATTISSSSTTSTVATNRLPVSTTDPEPIDSNSKVQNLEQRVNKLETIVQSQQKIIDELVRSLREETDKVKGLKTELDKYAQCVTQV